jgi:predicted DNA-binding transcriptional regulator YafY
MAKTGRKSMAKKKSKGTTPTRKMPNNPEVRQRSEEDRRAQQANRLFEMMKLVELLLGRGKWSTKTLAAELERSEKTIRRRLEVLSMAGVAHYYDSHEKCLRLMPGVKFPVLNLTPDELLGQAAASAITEAPGLDAAAAAKPVTRKIAAASSEEVVELLADAEAVMTVLNLKLADHSRHQDMIRAVQWALVKQRQVSGQYISPYKERPVKLTLHPYHLCFVNQAWYLIAWPMEGNVPKTYRIARFQSLRMIDSPAQKPNNFDLEEYFGNAWAVYRGAETHEVEIEFTKEAADLVIETCWHKTQKVNRHADGRVTLSFTVDGLEEILWWVLSWASRAKVIRPEKLREMVVEKLQAAIAMNSGEAV